MKNPFGDQPIPDSYRNQNERVLQKVRSANLHDRILEILQKTYEEALATESIVLSRAERNRLFFQTVKMVTDDVLKKLDRPSTDTEQ